MIKTQLLRASFAVGVLVGVPRAPALAACANPTATQVVVYRDANFGGSCWVLNKGLYPSPSPFANDTITSLKVGTATNAQMFQNSNYGGNVAFYGPGSYANVGSNANDSFSSAKILANNGISIAARYTGNTNSDDGNLVDIQGLAHDTSYFYVTSTTTISKYPLSGSGILQSPPVASHVGMFSDLANLGCNHYGDPDMLFAGGATYILIPVEGCTFPDIDGYSSAMHTALAVMNPSTLDLIAYDALYQNPNNAAYVATKGMSLYSSGGLVDGQNPIRKYAIDPNALFVDHNPHFIVYDDTPLFLTHEDGTPVSMNNMQGGVFSSDGRVLYTNNGYPTGCDAATEGGDWGGIRAFDASTGTRIASSSLTYGNFQFEWHCGFSQYQEPEGLDFVDLGPTGLLHAFMYSNADSATYFKHYNF